MIESVDRYMPNLMFKGMALMFRLRDLLEPREKILDEVDIRPGFHVLDYGCGPGGYVVETAERIGESGIIYALDIHPLAVQSVADLTGKRGLTNVETILSGCKTGLPGGSLDLVLLYDIFHMLSDPQAILTELHRVLKPGGALSFHDPHMREDDIVAGVTGTHLFRLAQKGRYTYHFAPT
jgi:ubiquinone/menaquinone biosynthesis C-methylase UbiE